MDQSSTRRTVLKAVVTGGAAMAVAPSLSAAESIPAKNAAGAVPKVGSEEELLMRYAGEFGAGTKTI